MNKEFSQKSSKLFHPQKFLRKLFAVFGFFERLTNFHLLQSITLKALILNQVKNPVKDKNGFIFYTKRPISQ